jgi:hypothetical protein
MSQPRLTDMVCGGRIRLQIDDAIVDIDGVPKVDTNKTAAEPTYLAERDGLAFAWSHYGTYAEVLNLSAKTVLLGIICGSSAKRRELGPNCLWSQTSSSR